jgi:hypothetical protein
MGFSIGGLELMGDWFTTCCWNTLDKNGNIIQQSYPTHKHQIKQEIIDMLSSLNESIFAYIEYCFEMDLCDELYTILEFATDFGLTKKERSKLETNIIMWKLTRI